VVCVTDSAVRTRMQLSLGGACEGSSERSKDRSVAIAHESSTCMSPVALAMVYQEICQSFKSGS
jgi:hypothetical protein